MKAGGKLCERSECLCIIGFADPPLEKFGRNGDSEDSTASGGVCSGAYTISDAERW